MFKKLKRNKNSNGGFSLVELIVTITIMAILVAALVPSLIGYIEDSHAEKDNTNMEGVVRAVETALADYDIYKAVVRYSTEVPAKYESAKKGDAGVFSTTERISKGITITFYSDEKDNPKEAKLSIDNAIVNAGLSATKGSLQVGNVPLTDMTIGSTETLYNRIVQIVGKSITLDSETYKNSNYTIFIALGEDITSVQVYGQWNGIELFESVGVEGVNNGGITGSFTIYESNRSKVGFTDTTANLVISKKVTITTNGASKTYNVVGIGSQAFLGCTDLISVTIPDSVTDIGSRAFANCSSIKNITILNSVINIGANAFDGCKALTSINFNGTKLQWKNITKGTGWNYSTGNFIVHCIDGDLTKMGAEVE